MQSSEQNILLPTEKNPQFGLHDTAKFDLTPSHCKAQLFWTVSTNQCYTVLDKHSSPPTEFIFHLRQDLDSVLPTNRILSISDAIGYIQHYASTYLKERNRPCLLTMLI